MIDQDLLKRILKNLPDSEIKRLFTKYLKRDRGHFQHRGDFSKSYIFGEYVISKIDYRKAEKEGQISAILNMKEALNKLGNFKGEYMDVSKGEYYIAQKRFISDMLIDTLLSGNMILSKKIDIALNAAKNLAEIHAAGIIHGDLHAGNMLTSGKIFDFDCCVHLQPGETEKKGIARRKDKQGSHVPKEWINNGLASYSADIYALGKILSSSKNGLNVGLNLDEEKYNSNFNEQDKEKIRDFIALMNSEKNEQRPGIKVVVSFLEAIKKKFTDKTINLPAIVQVPARSVAQLTAKEEVLSKINNAKDITVDSNGGFEVKFGSKEFAEQFAGHIRGLPGIKVRPEVKEVSGAYVVSFGGNRAKIFLKFANIETHGSENTPMINALLKEQAEEQVRIPKAIEQSLAEQRQRDAELHELALRELELVKSKELTAREEVLSKINNAKDITVDSNGGFEVKFGSKEFAEQFAGHIRGLPGIKVRPEVKKVSGAYVVSFGGNRAKIFLKSANIDTHGSENTPMIDALFKEQEQFQYADYGIDQILGKTKTSGYMHGCGVHSIAIVFAKLLTDGILEKNHLLDTDMYRRFLKFCEENCVPSPKTWEELKQILKDRGITTSGAQKYLNSAIRKFAAKIILGQQDSYDRFKDIVKEYLLIKSLPNLDAALIIDLVERIKDYGVNVTFLDNWDEKEEEEKRQVFIAGIQRLSITESNIEFCKDILVPTANALGFAVDYYSNSSLRGTISAPLNPVALVKLQNQGNYHWEVNKIYVDRKHQLLKTGNVTKAIDIPNQLKSLGYPTLLCENIVKDSGISPIMPAQPLTFKDYHSWLVDNCHFALDKLMKYKIDMMRSLINGAEAGLLASIIEKYQVSINIYIIENSIVQKDQISNILDRIDFSDEYRKIGTSKTPQEKLLMLSAILIDLNSHYCQQGKIAQKINNPKYYPEISEKCQIVFNNLSKGIQEEIYAYTQDYNHVMNMDIVAGKLSSDTTSYRFHIKEGQKLIQFTSPKASNVVDDLDSNPSSKKFKK